MTTRIAAALLATVDPGDGARAYALPRARQFSLPFVHRECAQRAHRHGGGRGGR